MILKSVRVREFKNVVDSGEVRIEDDVTCLVGRNESGKTALLEALYRLHPLPTGHPETFVALRDYPRRRYTREKDRAMQVHPISATFALDEEDKAAIAAACGSEAASCDSVTVAKTYANERTFTLGEHALGEPTGLSEVLEERLPWFAYFDECSLVSGRVSIPALQGATNPEGLTPGERTALSLLRLAEVDAADLASDDYEECKAVLETVAGRLADEVFTYWSQNRNLDPEFDVDFRTVHPQAPFLDVRIRDRRHGISLNFDERSQGFVWFFSFLAAFSQFRRRERTVVLLDEPGLGLHGSGQTDLLRFIEEQIAPSHQVVYSTHSAFMVRAAHPERVRTVYDGGARDGTRVGHDFLEAPYGTRLAVQGALGFDLLRRAFAQPNLFVERVSDAVFLTAMSAVLERRGRARLDPRFTPVPAGGLAQACAALALAGAEPPAAVVVSSRPGRAFDSPAGREALAQVRIVALEDFTREGGIHTEDLFYDRFYLHLVTGSGAATLESFEVTGTGPVVTRIEAATGVTLDRYLPARFLLRLTAVADDVTFAETLDEATLDRFERLFEAINALLA